MKNLLFTLVLFIGFQVVSKAQCNAPTNFNSSVHSADSITLTWSSPVDTFEIEYGLVGFIQSTGVLDTVYNDTTAFYDNLWQCTHYDFYIRRKCGSMYSNWAGPFLVKNVPFTAWSNGVYSLDFSHCGDSLFSPINGFSFANNYWNKPPDLPSSYSKLSNSWGFLYADGDKDTIMRYYTPWINFAGGTQDAVFFLYSNNVTTPGDNVSLRVHVDNGTTLYNNVYSYSGDSPKWEKVFIDLASYYSSTTNKIRLIFEVDQTTATIPKWNDFLIDELFIGDTSSCSIQNLISFSRPLPTDLLIKRPFASNMYTTYQYGPAGFKPNNGQSGSISTNNDSTYLSIVPNGTDWVYVKDSCLNSDIHKYTKWQGPYYIDSTYTYRIFGTIAGDVNSNCLLDTGDFKYQHMQVRLLPDNINGWSNSKGEFEFYVDSGNYTVRIFKWNINTPCFSNYLYINTDSVLQLNQNFLVDKVNMINSISIRALSPTLVLQGTSHDIGFEIKNETFVQVDSMKISYLIDTNTIEITSVNGWNYNSSNNLYSKTISSINPYSSSLETKSFKIKAKTGSNYLWKLNKIMVTIDTIYTGQVNYSLHNWDRNYIWNVAAIDPNDKQMSPAFETIIQDSILNFRIRFQNTGNYPASQVIVTDTLPQYLHNANFELIETSHNCITTLDSNHVLTFKFYNIQLPDSTTDFEGSKGYIDFNMHLGSAMQIGDTMANRAHIFFDYQPAVITNYAWIKVIDSCDLILPGASFTSNLDSLHASGVTMSFYSTALNAMSTTWDFGDGNTATGDSVSHVYFNNGSYTVTQTIVNNCGVHDSVNQSVAVGGIGITENLDPGFKVYPNPTQQKITIESLTKEPLDIVIYDVTGRKVFTQNMVGGKKVLDISDLPAGSYILKLVSPAGELKGTQMIQLQK